MSQAVRVGARELKTRLGAYLNRGRRGEQFIVTDRHEPIARRQPLSDAESPTAALDRLIATGAVTPPAGCQLEPFEPIRLVRRSGAAAVSRDRDERS